MDEIPFLPLICGLMFFVLAGGVLSMLKTALGNVREPRLRAFIENGNKKYQPVLEALEKSGTQLSTLRIWISFFKILSGCFGGFFLSGPLSYVFLSLGLYRAPAQILAILLTSCGIVFFFFIFCELILRQIALVFPEALSAALLPLIRFFSLPVFPLIVLNRYVSALLAKVLSAEAPAQEMIEAELRQTLLEGEKSGVVESEERTMVEGVFYLGNKLVSAFMTHRSEIEWLDINADAEIAKKIAEEFGSQVCFPVADGELDKVSGSVSTEDIFKALLVNPWPGLKSVMRTPYFIPETMSAIKAFEAFKKANANELFVMDEYGGFAGILTVSNLIEEIVGELSAGGEEEETILRQEDGTWLADGGVNIDEAARKLELSRLGEEQRDYHTLAGFILYLAGEIPRVGAYFDYHGYRFSVLGMDQNRIDKILISRI